MNNIFTICYSEEEANEIGHFILSRGYEGVQNDSYRYCRDVIRWAFKQANRHHSCFIYVGVIGCQMIVSNIILTISHNIANVFQGSKYV